MVPTGVTASGGKRLGSEGRKGLWGDCRPGACGADENSGRGKGGAGSIRTQECGRDRRSIDSPGANLELPSPSPRSPPPLALATSPARSRQLVSTLPPGGTLKKCVILQVSAPAAVRSDASASPAATVRVELFLRRARKGRRGAEWREWTGVAAGVGRGKTSSGAGFGRTRGEKLVVETSSGGPALCGPCRARPTLFYAPTSRPGRLSCSQKCIEERVSSQTNRDSIDRAARKRRSVPLRFVGRRLRRAFCTFDSTYLHSFPLATAVVPPPQKPFEPDETRDARPRPFDSSARLCRPASHFRFHPPFARLLHDDHGPS